MMIILALSLGEEGAKNLLKTIKTELEKLSGRFSDEADWGKRKFAYEINHQKEGYYKVLNFELEVKNLNIFKQKLNLMTGVVRYLITAATK